MKLKRPLAFVPTMGALHAGHESLIKLARERCEEVVVSIFVNPLQFENKEDLAKYPRTPEEDVARAEKAGATFVWQPTLEEIYRVCIEHKGDKKVRFIIELSDGYTTYIACGNIARPSNFRIFRLTVS